MIIPIFNLSAMPLQRIITIIIVITLNVVACSKKGTPKRVVIQNIETAVPIVTPVTLNVNAMTKNSTLH